MLGPLPCKLPAASLQPALVNCMKGVCEGALTSPFHLSGSLLPHLPLSHATSEHTSHQWSSNLCTSKIQGGGEAGRGAGGTDECRYRSLPQSI